MMELLLNFDSTDLYKYLDLLLKEQHGVPRSSLQPSSWNQPKDEVYKAGTCYRLS